MFEVQKTVEFSACHNLKLPYTSPCTQKHGHNWKVTICCRSDGLDPCGMVIDFVDLKQIVLELDHRDLNKVLGRKNPTAENIAEWICTRTLAALRDRQTENDSSLYTVSVAWVSVQESDGNIARYLP